MARHHTKDKGDLGVAKAFADLVGKGFLVLFPATEHAPFDLVAYDGDRFLRVQVKFRSALRGRLLIDFRSVWSDRHGAHKKAMDKSSVDVVCVYSPSTDECYYLRPADHGQTVSLRVSAPLNNQESGVLMASDFRHLPV